MKKNHSSLQKKFLFLVVFAIIGFALIQVKVPNFAGTKITFTLFDFFGPVAGSFLGGVGGIFAVLAVSVSNLLLNGTIETGSIIRLFPTLFAVYYFSIPKEKMTDKKILVVPLSAIIVFIAHPEGRAAWYFTLLWLIPVIAFFRRDNLFTRALGTTFTAHAVGGAAWVWAFNLQASVWKNLIPVVIYERLFFAVGISISYFIINNVISLLVSRKIIPRGLATDSSYQVVSPV